MSAMIPVLPPFDQSTLEQMRAVDPIVQRSRALLALFDWSHIDPCRKRGPGNPGHPSSAYLKALLVRISEHLSSTPGFRAYLLDHPLLVLELGFRPHMDLRQPYGFDVAKTVPSVRHLNHILRSLDAALLADLFAQTVQALHQEIPGLGEVVAFDVKHIYANVKENNPRQYVKERYHKDRQLKAAIPMANWASNAPPTKNSPMARGMRRERVPVGLRLRHCHRDHPRLRGGGARRFHSNERVRTTSPTSSPSSSRP